MLNLRKASVLILALVLVLALSSLVLAQTTPSVTINDQAVTNGAVTVQQVVATEPGWIVIHADANGSPGSILGYSPVKAGVNDNVAVHIDTAKMTETMYAMLHVDKGTVGTFEFPGPDVPVQVNGKIVMTAFKDTNFGAMATGTAPVELTPTAAAAVTTAAPAAAAVTSAATAAMATPLVSHTATPSTLPTTGGSSTTMWVLLALGGLSLLTGVGLSLSRRPQ